MNKVLGQFSKSLFSSTSKRLKSLSFVQSYSVSFLNWLWSGAFFFFFSGDATECLECVLSFCVGEVVINCFNFFFTVSFSFKKLPIRFPSKSKNHHLHIYSLRPSEISFIDRTVRQVVRLLHECLTDKYWETKNKSRVSATLCLWSRKK